MSKTSRKSLLTGLLASCLLISQAALLGHPSTTHAATGPSIFVNPGSSSYQSNQAITVTGSGFTPNGNVLVAFNTPYSSDGSPFSQSSIPPAVNRPGDNKPSAPASVQGDQNQNPLPNNNQYPNVLLYNAQADVNGNLVASNTGQTGATGGNGQVRIQLPTSAVDGVYEITAYDISGTAGAPGTAFVPGSPGATSNTAATQYRITRGASQPLQVTPVSGASAQIEGDVQVTARPNTFNNGDRVGFFLEDFAASQDFGTPSVPSFTGFDSLIAPASTALPLKIVACGTSPVNNGSSNNVLNGNTCQASINGDVAATVQINRAAATLQNLNNTQVSYNGIRSTYYYDQVYSIVAKSQGNTAGLQASTTVVAAGFHLDHGFTRITLGNNQVGIGGATIVSGTGFGAGSTVQVYLVALTGAAPGNSLLLGQGGNTAPPLTSGYYSTNILLGSFTADSNGSFTATIGIPSNPNLLQLGSGNNGTLTGGFPAFLLAEDFSNIDTLANGTLGARLNEVATAAITVPPPSGGTGLQIGTFSIPAAGTTTATAAVSSTVTITGTGYLPNEAVDVIIAGSGSSSTVLSPGVPVPPPGSTACNAEQILTIHANAAGLATGSFLVPENCNTVTISGGVINGGSTVTVSAIGEQSAITDKNTLIIPKTAALAAPVNGILQAGTNIPISLSGSGFAANEPVTFQFGQINAFTGVLGTPVLSLTGTSDAAGNVNLPAQTIANAQGGLLTGGLYTLTARGLASSFSSTISVGVPFIAINGNLNCPTSVLPGQPFAVSGQNFVAGTPLFVTITGPTGALLPSVTNPTIPTPLVVSNPTTDTTGSFVITPTFPLTAQPGTYTLSVTGLISNPTGGSFQQQIRECTITVGSTSPRIQDNPVAGPIGTTTTVTGQGFAPNEPIVVSLQYIDATGAITGTDVTGTAQAITTTDVNGNFVSVYNIKSTVNALIPGQYNLTATGQFNPRADVARTIFTVTSTALAPVTSIYFAEGYTGTVAAGANADFNEAISILNANNFTTTYTVTYFLENAGVASTTKAVGGVIGPNSVVQRSVNTDVGLNVKVAASVSSPAVLGAERIIARSVGGKALDSSSSLGQLLNLGTTAPDAGFNYYFASGEVQLTNEEYLTMLNPTNTAASVTVTILAQTAISATTSATIAPITLTVAPNSRATLPIRARLIASGIQKFGVTVNSNVALATERVEYFGDGIGSGKYGSTTKPAGTSAFRQYIFSSDVATFPSAGGNAIVGTGSDISQIDVINPGAASAGSATVTVSFFDKNGAAINSQQVQVDGGTRETINVNNVVGTQADVFSVIVTSDKNIFAEKPVFYGGDPNNGGTHAVESPSGSPAGLTSVAFPYLDLVSITGTPLTQTVYLYNPGATTITVRGTYVIGTATVVKTYTVKANSITTVSVNADAATLAPKAALGGIFQIVPGSNQGDSFVASVVSNTPDFAVVVGDQGTYPLGFATGS